MKQWIDMNAQQEIKTHGKQVLLGESQMHNRESLVNQLLMAGAGQVGVAVNANELIRFLKADSYDLVLLGLSIFAEKQVKKELEIFHCNHVSSIIVILDDEDISLTTHQLNGVLKENNVYLCVLRSTAGKLLKIMLNE